MLELSAPAKVNLFLRILARQPCGFHELETLFAALAFGDTIELAGTPSGISLETEGPLMGPEKQNLAFRAAEAFFELAGVPGGVRIRLRKKIPVAAGLGGGSSDAAAVLRGLQELFPGVVDHEALLRLAGALGSDVPFFLSGSPLALGRGRGEKLEPLPPLPPAPVLLVLPSVQVPTVEAYRLLAQDRERIPQPREPRVFPPGALRSWEEVAGLAENDFESVIFREYPSLGRLREVLKDQGPLLSLLSGSGATLFSVFSEEREAILAAEELREAVPDTGFLLTQTAD